MNKPINEKLATKLWQDGLLDREICELLGYNQRTFSNWRAARGMASNRGIFEWDGARRNNGKRLLVV